MVSFNNNNCEQARTIRYYVNNHLINVIDENGNKTNENIVHCETKLIAIK